MVLPLRCMRITHVEAHVEEAKAHLHPPQEKGGDLKARVTLLNDPLKELEVVLSLLVVLALHLPADLSLPGDRFPLEGPPGPPAGLLLPVDLLLLVTLLVVDLLPLAALPLLFDALPLVT